MRDSSRKTIAIELHCSIHKDVKLRVSSTGDIGANSAKEVNPKIYVHKCSECEFEHRNLFNAVAILMESRAAKELTTLIE